MKLNHLGATSNPTNVESRPFSTKTRSNNVNNRNSERCGEIKCLGMKRHRSFDLQEKKGTVKENRNWNCKGHAETHVLV